MQPIDNSDLAWLIIADFLADQGKISESEELRESVNNPENDVWNHEHRSFDCVGGQGTERVGGNRAVSDTVGSFSSRGSFASVGGSARSDRVGSSTTSPGGGVGGRGIVGAGI